MQTPCSQCANLALDPENGEDHCAASLDEDDMEAFLRRDTGRCPFFEPGDEYRLVRHQN